MSYQSFKRVLGETSLERKCRILFGVCLFLLIAASFSFYGYQTEKIVNEQNRNTGWLLTVEEMQVRHWKKVPPPRAQDVFEPKATTETVSEEWELLAKSLAKSLSEQPYKAQFILPNSSAPNAEDKDDRGDIVRPKGAIEWDILKRFMDNKSPKPKIFDQNESYGEFSEDGSSYTYYQSIRANRTCTIGCHQSVGKLTGDASLSEGAVSNSTADEDGDLMAVAKLTFSTEPTRTAINVNRGIMLTTAIITVFLAMVASYVIVRYVIVKPLHHLRDVSDSISHGNSTLRAEIHTGDEFEELAVAFNRMLRHLTDAQDELLQANVSLDGKVDELAQANMRLYEMNMLKSDFLATMSHELRTPLNSILGFSDVLGSIDSLDDKQKRYVQNIQKSGRTLLEMINDILDLAKIESGKMETRLSEFRVTHVVAAQCDMARPLTEKKNIDLDVHADPDLPPMRQDQARIQQILNNLLSNAIKFTPEGGRITVSVRRDEANFMLLDVADTGVGITEEDQQSIFDKFRQGRTAVPSGDAMTREYSGSGLGLSIVKELCKLLGGNVSLQSELGKGSTFIVRLPWTFEEQPRLDSALVESLEEFTKQRFDLSRDRSTADSQ
jgi:two-component system, NarL family, sensor histidine kinase BarA